MRRLVRVACLLAVLPAGAGCAAVADGLVAGLIDAPFRALGGGTAQQRRDGQRMNEYRDFWSNPGRPPDAVESEARRTFRKVNGRDPDLAWMDR